MILLRKILKHLLPVSTLFLLIGAAHATQLNVTFSDEIKNNQYPLNFNYVLYIKDSDNVITKRTESIDQIEFNRFGEWLSFFNKNDTESYVDEPQSGEHSHFSFGYRKNDTDVSPASCQNISISNMQTLNIMMTETGCIVS